MQSKDMMMKKARLGAIAIVIFALACVVIPIQATAGGSTPRCDDGSCNDTEQHQGQLQGQGQHQGQGQRQHAEGGDGGNATGGAAYADATGGEASANAMSGANNEGVDVSNNTTFSSESNNTNVVLVPNNNTSNCMRVWGISFGTSDGAAGLGLPTRDKSCDFEQAADDAAATGNHEIAWYWRCHKPNLYKTFRQRGEEDRSAIMDCFREMRDMISVPGSDEPVPTGQVIITEEEYDSLLLAQVQQEELDEVREQAEYRYAQQQSLIDTLEQELEDHEDNLEELERLKQEAARLSAAQEAEEEERDDIRARARARLARYEEQGEDGEEDDGREN